MKVQKAYRFRLYPDQKQAFLFRKTFGCCRFLYNQMLRDRITQYKETGKMQRLTPASYKEKYPWLKEVDSLALANVQLHLESAYKKFFKYETGYPKYKSRSDSRASYTTNVVNGNIRLKDGKLRLPKVGNVKIRCHRNIPDEYILKSVTISKEPSGKYFASLLYEYTVSDTRSVVKDSADMRVLSIAFSSDKKPVFSDGFQIQYPLYCLTSEQKLAKQERKLSLCLKGSRNYEKQKKILSQYQEKLQNQKKDYLHKLSRNISDSYDMVLIKNLPVKDTGHNYMYSTASDNNYDAFRDMLGYKLADRGKEAVIIKHSLPHRVKYVNRGARGDSLLMLSSM